MRGMAVDSARRAGECFDRRRALGAAVIAAEARDGRRAGAWRGQRWCELALKDLGVNDIAANECHERHDVLDPSRRGPASSRPRARPRPRAGPLAKHASSLPRSRTRRLQQSTGAARSSGPDAWPPDTAPCRRACVRSRASTARRRGCSSRRASHPYHQRAAALTGRYDVVQVAMQRASLRGIAQRRSRVRRIAPRILLKSWAIPPASVRIDSSRCACRRGRSE